MRHSRLILSLLIILAAGLSSCTKARVVSETTSSEFGGCTHDDLTHCPAKAPTYDECGNVEYWECPACGKRFSDSAATVPFTGYKYILPTKFVDPAVYMGQYSTKSTISTVTAIVCIASLAVSLGGFIATLVSIVDSTEDIAKQIEELCEMEDKSLEQILLLEELNDELLEKVVELNESLSLTQETAHELVAQMNVTQQLMNSSESLENAILLAIMKSEHDIEVAKLLDSRYKNLQNLKFSCVSAVRSISEYIDRSRSELELATTSSDSLDVFSDTRKNILAVVGSWGSEKACYASQTSTLLADFLGMSYDDKTSFLDMFSESASDILPFSHDIVVIKKLFAAREMGIMALGTFLSSCYYRNCCGSGNLYAQKTAVAMEERFQQCQDMTNTFFAKWDAESNVGPWYCNVTGRYFQTKLIWLDVKNFVSNNTMTMKNNIMVSSYYPLSTFYGVSEEDALSELEWELVRKDYLLNNTVEAADLKTLLFSTDRPGMIFEDSAPKDYARTITDIAFSVPYSSSEYFSLVDKDDLYYTCFNNDFTIDINLVEYNVVDGEPNPNGSNYFYYIGSNGRTRFYTIRTSE